MPTSSSTAEAIALFPIPNCVAFPGTLFPLHVFEPRYRNMVKHCIDNNMRMGISHTQKLVSQGKDNKNLKEALQSNQATYKPYPVFSAGTCELLETLEDGRLRISVHLEQRYTLGTQIQTLPFSIYSCEPLKDQPLSEEEKSEAELLKEKLLTRLSAITSDIPEVQKLLHSDTWQNKDPESFSFELFGLLRLDAQIQQEILEMQNPLARLERTLAILNNAAQ